MALKNHSLDAPRETASLLHIDLLNERELLSLRAQIDERLNLGTLAEIDLSAELTLQLRTVKSLQSAAMDDAETPFGQKAQTAMAVQRLLQDLTKMRTDVHNAERAKLIESMVIKAFMNCSAAEVSADSGAKALLDEIKGLFFEQYEALLAAVQAEDEPDQ